MEPVVEENDVASINTCDMFSIRPKDVDRFVR
jgi:hypothetical protein